MQSTGLSLAQIKMIVYIRIEAFTSPINSALKLPPNNKVQNDHRIPVPFTVILWLNNFGTEGRYFSRWMNHQYLIVRSYGPNTIGIALLVIDYEVALFDIIPDYSGI